MRVLLDENGYVKEWAMCPADDPNHEVLPDGIEVPDLEFDEASLEQFYEEYRAYHVVEPQLVKDESKELLSESAEPTQLDRVEAQVTYTAMMTDTLLEV